VDVVLPVGGEVVVDDEADLLDVNAAGEQVCRDQDTAGAGPELPHDHVTLLYTRDKPNSVTAGRKVQCCGSGSESGSTCFWASWIRIH
jgi:hypothetical protein